MQQQLHELLVLALAQLAQTTFPTVPTKSHFAFVFSFGLLSFAAAPLTRSVFARAFGLPFPSAIVHGIDVRGVIVSRMVPSWVPVSLGRVVPDERVRDTGMLGGLALRLNSTCALSEDVNVFIKNADQNGVSKDFFCGGRTFGSVVLTNLEVVNNSAEQVGFHHSAHECEALVYDFWLEPQAKSSPCFESASVGTAPNDVQCCVRRGGGQDEL